VYLHDNFIFTSVIEEINAWIEVKHEEAAGLMVLKRMSAIYAIAQMWLQDREEQEN
jgi:hypothetical protein